MTLVHRGSEGAQPVSALSLPCFRELRGTQEGIRLEKPSTLWSFPAATRPPLFPSSKTTIRAPEVTHQRWFFPGSSSEMLLPPLHLLSLPASSAMALERGCSRGWSHHRNGDSGLLRTPSCSPAAPREPRSCCRYSRSRSTPPVAQNPAKRYQPTQGRAFGANHFSHLLFKHVVPESKAMQCTSQHSYRAFSVHTYQVENLISWFYYFDACQKSSNFSKSTRALCKELGYDPGWR